MLRPSSSISSSDRRRRERLRAVVETWLWTLAALAVLDVAMQRAFPMPADANLPPGTLARYFDYGRSIEGKLARLVGPTDAHSAPIVVAGWIDRECGHTPPPLLPGRSGVTIYGMSFSAHIAGQLEQLAPTLAISSYAGPAAPPNHSYACFQSVNAAGDDPNGIQIFGVLASSISKTVDARRPDDELRSTCAVLLSALPTGCRPTDCRTAGRAIARGPARARNNGLLPRSARCRRRFLRSMADVTILGRRC